MLNKSELYDQLYDEASAILERDKPCEVSCGECLDSRLKARGQDAFCCHSCKYLTPTGCSVKALACRVWLCYAVQDAHPTTYIALNDVKRRAQAAGILMQFRGSKEDILSGNLGARMSRG